MRFLSALWVAICIGTAASALAQGQDSTSKSQSAPGSELTMTVPAGWEEEAGWFYRSLPDGNGRVPTAYIRFPARVTPSGSMSDMLRKLWTTEIPVEGKDRASGIVFRRYVGDQLLTQFIWGNVREKDRKCDSVYTLYLIDCKTYWQPVVVALTYDSPHLVSIEMSAGASYPESMAEAEKFLDTLRCPEAKAPTLLDSASIVGNYTWGSGSFFSGFTMAGNAATDFMSRAGALNLKRDGTFEYLYSSAGGRNSATTFAGAKGSGKWAIKGDLLICSYSKYDQGDGYKLKEHRYRIASLCNFQNGTKVAVLVKDLDKKINALNVYDGSDWYFTGDPNK